MRPTTTSPLRSYHGLPRGGRASHHCIVAHERQAWYIGASGLPCHCRGAPDGMWHPPCENRNCSPFGPPEESQLRDGAPVREGRRSVRGWLCMYSQSSVTRFDQDRKSTRLNSSHLVISYAVFCLKKKKNN